MEKVACFVVRIDQGLNFLKYGEISAAFVFDELPAFMGSPLESVVEDSIDMTPTFRIHVRELRF